MDRIEYDSFIDIDGNDSLKLQEMYLQDLAQEEMWNNIDIDDFDEE